MKILHVIPSMDPVTGGPPMIAARIAAAQASQGCQLAMISYKFPGSDARVQKALSSVPNIQNVRMEYFPPFNKFEYFSGGGARHAIEKIIGDFDLLHLHGVWDRSIYAAATVAHQVSKPFVITLHGMLDPWSLSQKPLKKRLALFLGYHTMLNRAAFLHCGNDDEVRLIEPLRLTPPRYVVPNGIFLEEIEPLPPKGTFRAAHPEFANEKLILFLSRIHYKKGLDYLADSFAIVAKEFPDVRLVVAGPDDGARADFESQIARLGIASRVHLVGPLYATEKLAAMIDCDCFCLPSRQEGFSLAVIEAMACSAPVVITPGCHFPEVAKANAGIISPLDASKIAESLATLLRDPQKAKTLGQNARNLIVSAYTWPKIAEQLIDCYKKI